VGRVRVVPSVALSLVPAAIPFEQAAILADAVSTPYAGLVDRAARRAGESIGLWGIGGLGVHAVQVARMAGAAPIVAVDPMPAARARALEFGADVAHDPNADDIPGTVSRLTDGLMLDVTVDLFGSNAALAQAVRCTARFERTVMIGLSHQQIQLGAGAIFGLRSQALLGHLGYRKEHLDQLVALLARGRLDVSRSISAILPLDDVVGGVDMLATKRGNPIRLVIRP
jgi:threonine dehydrogenase-like Zn-dependent dehydrogenase